METRHATLRPNGLDESKKNARLMEDVEKFQHLVFDESKRLEYGRRV